MGKVQAGLTSAHRDRTAPRWSSRASPARSRCWRTTCTAIRLPGFGQFHAPLLPPCALHSPESQPMLTLFSADRRFINGSLTARSLPFCQFIAAILKKARAAIPILATRKRRLRLPILGTLTGIAGLAAAVLAVAPLRPTMASHRSRTRMEICVKTIDSLPPV